MSHLRRRIVAFLSGHWVILSNAGSMVGAMLVTSVLGVAYWWIATHNFPEAAVGSASAAISAMLLLGSVGVFGFTTLIVGELPRMRGREGSFISSALIASGCASALLGLGFALLAPEVAPGFRTLRGDAVSVAVFAVGTAFVALALVVDNVFLALLRSKFQFVRNAAMAASKLLALLALAHILPNRSSAGVVATWVLGTAMSFVVPAWFVFARRFSFGSWRPDWSILRGLGRTVLAHHALNLSLQLPGMALPLVVVTLLSAKANAYFYAAWLIAGFLFFVPSTITSVLYAAGSWDRGVIASKMRFTLGASVSIGVVTNVIFLTRGANLLATFGHAYSTQGAVVLGLLGLVVFPLTIKNHYIAIHRIRRLTARAAAYAALGGFLELLLATIGALRGGIVGLSVGWGGAVVLEALLMGFQVYRLMVQPGGFEDADAEPASSPKAEPPPPGKVLQETGAVFPHRAHYAILCRCTWSRAFRSNHGRRDYGG